MLLFLFSPLFPKITFDLRLINSFWNLLIKSLVFLSIWLFKVILIRFEKIIILDHRIMLVDLRLGLLVKRTLFRYHNMRVIHRLYIQTGYLSS